MTNHESSFRFARILLLGLLLFGWCEGSAPAQPDRRQLTLEWIFGPEGRAVASVPATAWLDDGTLILLDNHRLLREQTFDKLNPTTGHRQSLVDSPGALPTL